MKKLFLILSIILFNISCNAQDNEIHSDSLTINGNNFLGSDISTVTQSFGTPISIEDYYYELGDFISKKYIYSGILFYSVDNKVYSFEITGSNYNFTSYNISIGDNIEIFETIFPLSYANKEDGKLAFALSDIDRFVEIYYNTITKIINKIALRSY